MIIHMVFSSFHFRGKKIRSRKHVQGWETAREIMRAWHRQLEIHGGNSVQLNNTRLCFNLLIEPSPQRYRPWQVRCIFFLFIYYRYIELLIRFHAYIYREKCMGTPRPLISISLRTNEFRLSVSIPEIMQVE